MRKSYACGAPPVGHHLFLGLHGRGRKAVSWDAGRRGWRRGVGEESVMAAEIITGRQGKSPGP